MYSYIVNNFYILATRFTSRGPLGQRNYLSCQLTINKDIFDAEH